MEPTPVFLPGESQEMQSLVGCCLWGCTELDMTDVTQQQQQQQQKSGSAIPTALLFFFFPEVCFVYLEYFVVLYKFQGYLFQFCGRWHGCFDWECIKFVIPFGSMDILTILIILLQKHEISFHLFLLSLVLQFLTYRSFTYFVSFISRYFIPFDAILSDFPCLFSIMVHYYCIEKQHISVQNSYIHKFY